MESNLIFIGIIILVIIYEDIHCEDKESLLKILREKKPRAFLLENVKALKLLNGGKLLKTILEELSHLGYYAKSAVLNSLDYGDIPHNKERLYIAGFIDMEEFNIFEFPEKLQLNNMLEDIINLKEEKDKKYYSGKGIEYLKEIKAEVTARRAGDPAVLIASSEKAISELGWAPKFNSLETIIETAWNWHRNHPNGYEK
jgi:site-specific DNA-cytosine methylase